MPSPPAHLSAEARQEWDRVAEMLYKSGLLTAIDGTALAAYCQSYGRWRQAERALAETAKQDQLTDGFLVKTKQGNAIQSPLLGIANRAMSDMVRYSAEFGMTPSSRSRVTAAPPGEFDPSEGFFR